MKVEPADPRKTLENISATTTSNTPSPLRRDHVEPPKPNREIPEKPRILKHEARAGDLRLTYSIAEDNLATNPQLMNLLVEKLSAVLFFCAISESVAAHVLSDFQTMIDEFRQIFAPKEGDAGEPTGV